MAESEIEYLYRLKRDIEDRIDTLAPSKPEPAGPTGPLPKLAVIVGHSRKSPGAWGQPPVSTNEYFWNTDLAEMMEWAAPALLVMKTFFRDDGGVRGAYSSATTWGADAIIELHFNAASASATGTETIHINRPGCKELAAKVQDAMVAALGLHSRGIKLPWAGRGQSNLEAAGAIPAVIVEPFFGSNPADCIRAVERMPELAKALVTGAAAFLKERT